jgi:hypothetical protein
VARVTTSEPTIDEINCEFPDAEAFTSNGMCYAKLAGITIIAAAPSTGELRDQIHDYFDRTHRMTGGEQAAGLCGMT